MPEHTTGHNNASAAAAPIITTTTTTTITSSKKTSVEDERDVNAPKVSYKKATVTALATGAVKEEKKREGELGGNGSEVKTGEENKGVDVKVNQREGATKSAEGGGGQDATHAETGIRNSSRINEADQKSAELVSDRVNIETSSGDGSTNVEGGSKSAEVDKTDTTSANRVSKSAEEVTPGNTTSAKDNVSSKNADSTNSGTCVDPDKASKRDEPNTSAQLSETKPLDVDEPSNSAEHVKTTPTSGEGSTAGTSKPVASAAHEPGADEKVGEYGLSPRDAVHSNNVRNADEVIKSWGPVLQVRNLYPGMGPSFFMMEKSVFDHPLRQVLSALDYYEELRKRATLTQNQQRLVAIAEHTRDELRRLQRVRDGSVGVDAVDL